MSRGLPIQYILQETFAFIFLFLERRLTFTSVSFYINLDKRRGGGERDIERDTMVPWHGVVGAIEDTMGPWHGAVGTMKDTIGLLHGGDGAIGI